MVILENEAGRETYLSMAAWERVREIAEGGGWVMPGNLHPEQPDRIPAVEAGALAAGMERGAETLDDLEAAVYLRGLAGFLRGGEAPLWSEAALTKRVYLRMDLCREVNGTAILLLSGQLVGEERARFISILRSLEQEPGKRLVLDLSRVTYIDSGGAGLLLGACRRFRVGGWVFRATGATGQVKHILELTKLSTLLWPEE